MMIDQQTRRRLMRHGLTAFDPDRAAPGYLLFTPVFGPGTVFLLDHLGNEVHRWEATYRPGLSSYLLPNGHLFYQGKLPPEDVPGIGLWSAFSGGVMAELVEPYFVELALVRTGFAAGSQFVFSQHCKGARAAGISDEKVAAIPHWSVTDIFDAKERAVLAYTDELVLSHGRVQDGTFAALKAHFSDEAILELTYISLLYLTYAIFTRALRLEYDDVPERVVEIPIPGGAGGAKVDIMSQMSGEPVKR